MSADTDRSYLMNTYARLPVAFTRGEGAWLWDEEDNCYLDATARVTDRLTGLTAESDAVAFRVR